MNANNPDDPGHLEVSEKNRRAEDRFGKCFQANPTPQAVISRNGQTFYEANESFFTLFGYTREALRDLTLERLIVFADFATERKILEQVAAGLAVRKISCQIETPDHQFRDAFLYAEPLSLDDADGCLLMIEDVTEQRQLESQLRQAQKMQVLGQLAAGVTHDFKNILTIIHGYTAVLLESGKLDESVARSFQKVNDAAHRASRLTEQLLAFSRQQRMGVRPLDLSTTLHGFSEILTRCLTETITLELAYAEGLPQIEGDAGQIEQVLMNLAVNARDAMPKGGKLRISTRSLRLSEENRPNDREVKAGRHVCLSVSDTGCGMDEVTRERIFEPFFTTKEVGKGTGLGLATVNGIVKQHGGWIEVQSAPGAGTTFEVFFPVAKSVALEHEVTERLLTRPAIHRHKRILVVEDEATVREVVCETLATIGYPVVPAADGLEALEIFSQASERFDLLLTDMVMPNGISGMELANRLNQQQPKLKVVYMSGYSPDWTEGKVELVQGVNFVPKPYDPNELLKAVADQLSAA